MRSFIISSFFPSDFLFLVCRFHGQIQRLISRLRVNYDGADSVDLLQALFEEHKADPQSDIEPFFLVHLLHSLCVISYHVAVSICACLCYLASDRRSQ
jgi:hypothetical protein